MIIQHDGTATVMEAEGKPSNFKIQASATAFKILSSQLYTNKILAVVRELICNGIDSHTAAGNPDPVDVYLPTRLSPTFRVADRGVGLSDDEITELYCTYFSSAKNHTNDLIGGFGLGSKSPFAYTNGFSITSVYQGIKRIYDAHLNVQGMPEVVMLLQEATDEPNGVEVSVPVEPQDNSKFKQEAETVLEFLSDKVKVFGYEVCIKKTKYCQRGDDWALRDDDDLSLVRFVQGGIGYKVSLSALGFPYTAKGPFDIWCKPGELELAVSREALSLTEETRALCCAKIEQATKGVVKKLKEQVAQCTDLYSARELVHSFCNVSGLLPLSPSKFFGVYPNFTLDSLTVTFNQFDFPNLTAYMTSKSCIKPDAVLFANKEDYNYKTALAKATQESTPTLKQIYDHHSKVVWIENDLGKKLNHNVTKDFLIKNACKHAFIIHKVANGDDEKYQKELKAFSALFGIPVLHKATDLVVAYKAAKPKPVAVKKEKPKLFKFNSDSYDKWFTLFAPADPSTLAAGANYYLKMNYNIPTWLKGSLSAMSFKVFIESILKSEYFFPSDTEIYAFPENKCPKENDPNWVDLEKFVMAKLKDNEAEVLEMLKGAASIKACTNSVNLIKLILFSACLGNPKLKNLVSLYEKYKALDKKKVDCLGAIIKTLNPYFVVEKFDFSVAYVTEVKSAYPMMSLVEYEGLEEKDLQIIKDYFKFCEKAV